MRRFLLLTNAVAGLVLALTAIWMANELGRIYQGWSHNWWLFGGVIAGLVLTVANMAYIQRVPSAPIARWERLKAAWNAPKH
jgi:uncharacterized membrane protein YdcZ (DUF606 family)